VRAGAGAAPRPPARTPAAPAARSPADASFFERVGAVELGAHRRHRREHPLGPSRPTLGLAFD
jgi:hypothetical protein